MKNKQHIEKWYYHNGEIKKEDKAFFGKVLSIHFYHFNNNYTLAFFSYEREKLDEKGRFIKTYGEVTPDNLTISVKNNKRFHPNTAKKLSFIINNNIKTIANLYQENRTDLINNLIKSMAF